MVSEQPGPGAGRAALVTGANRGLGLAVAARLHEQGFTPVVSARRGADAAAATRQVGERATAIELDVTDPASVARAVGAVGEIDVLINNAGVLLDQDDWPSTVPADLVERCLAVNLLGAWRVTQAFLPGMVKRGWGRVVMVSSGTGSFSNGIYPRTPAYSVSKTALNALTVMFAEETRGTGVLVNAVNPGMVRTRMRPEASQLPAQAAISVADAAALPGDGPSGTFLRGSSRLAW